MASSLPTGLCCEVLRLRWRGHLPPQICQRRMKRKVGRAMNLIEAVTLADVIYLDEIDFSQQVNSPIDLGLPTGPIVIRGRRVPQTPGPLPFKLNSFLHLTPQQPFSPA